MQRKIFNSKKKKRRFDLWTLSVNHRIIWHFYPCKPNYLDSWICNSWFWFEEMWKCIVQFAPIGISKQGYKYIFVVIKIAQSTLRVSLTKFKWTLLYFSIWIELECPLVVYWNNWCKQKKKIKHKLYTHVNVRRSIVRENSDVIDVLD
jgi:hypothetical protein